MCYTVGVSGRIQLGGARAFIPVPGLIVLLYSLSIILPLFLVSSYKMCDKINKYKS